MFAKLKKRGRLTLRRKVVNREVVPTASKSKKVSLFALSNTTTSEINEINRTKRVAFLKGGIQRTDLLKKASKGNINSGWSFSSISLPTNGRIDVACDLLLDAYNTLNIDQSKIVDETYLRAAIRSFILEVASKYGNSAFHNFAHAVDVAQLMSFTIKKYFKKRVQNSELFYLVIAALCHDLGHIGVTTSTLKNLHVLDNTETLEDFHIAETLNIFNNPKISLLSENILDSKYKDELEHYCVELIQATDINKCHQYLNAAKHYAKSHQPKRNSKLPMEYLAILMKVSDLANVTRDFSDSSVWGEKLKVEMRAETEFNESFKIPKFLNTYEKLQLVQQEVFVLQRRIKKNEFELHKGLANNTLTFMSSAVLPIFEVLPDICPTFAKDYQQRVKENERRWRTLL